MARYLQRVVRNGNSAQVTLPRPLLFATQLRPGDFVEVEDFADGHVELRPWKNAEHGKNNRVGRIDTDPPAVPR